MSWAAAGMTGAQRTVLVAVWARCGDDGATWASLATLAADAAMTRGYVARTLAAAADAGLLTTTRLGRRTVRTLTPPAVDNCSSCAPTARNSNTRSRAGGAHTARSQRAPTEVTNEGTTRTAPVEAVDNVGRMFLPGTGWIVTPSKESRPWPSV